MKKEDKTPLHVQKMRMELGLSWNLLFASLVWKLWKRRNDLTFNNPALTDAVVIGHNLAWAKYYSNGVTPDKVPPSISRSKTLSWSTLGLGWVCLNVDGVVSLPLCDGRIGGLIRNNDDDWIVEFAKAICY
ncbi:hypothetical protein V6N12_069167 [Hibiscus sabdariffa]|uniref:RNase H type-1 domain-containing protein n=1 Tax=Hibiscus sabdariffa TaxID=183260 RepID=A0ABR2FD16_9ROSI